MSSYDQVLAFWKKKAISTEAELAEALSGKCIAYAYHSGKIENDHITYNDTREIFEHDGVTNYTGDLRTLFEMRNARDAHELFLKAFDSRHPLDESFILELQRVLTLNTYDTRRYQMGERPGEYKKNDYVTGRYEIGASPEETPEEMAELLQEMQDFPEEQALTAAAYFHVKFENIHPFADGNGRTGRMAMNYLLVLHDHPPIIIHEEDRKACYEALEAWDKDLVLDPMLDFLRVQAIKTWDKQTEKQMGK